MKIVITGATGLVGSHLAVRLLENRDSEIHCTSRSQKSTDKLRAVCNDFGADFSKLKIHYIPLEQNDELTQFFRDIEPDIVFHTAAIVSLEGGNETQMITSNVELTATITESLLDLKSRGKEPLLIHISSIAALGTKPYPELTDESCQIESIAKISAYSRSKFLSENEVWRAQRMGLRVIIVNPSIVVGVASDGSEREGIQKLFKLLSGGIPAYTLGAMGFVDVRDLSEAMYQLAFTAQSGNKEIEGNRYILNGVNLNFKEFITTFNQAFGKRKPPIYISKTLLTFVIQTLALWSKIRGAKPLITPSSIGYMTNQTAYDGTKIERTIEGFKYRDFGDSAKMVAQRFKM